MATLLKLIEMIPQAIRLPIVFLMLGGAATLGAEARYMTVSDFTKSYVLDLKSEIRQLRQQIADPATSADVRALLREQLEALLDELCYEIPDDPYCKNR